ncbi:hypothetical protein [Streptomyces sp. G45]|uniref:hypothetical protein n=1 Tax=Streptomyces sp. G45 TaxID=3406627 RepID=UPI003C1F4937
MSIPPQQPPNPYQNNPYAQPPQGAPAQPPQAAPPPGPYAYAQPPGAGQPPAPLGPPGAPSAQKKPTPGWLWAVGGAVVASAVWAGALFATGTLGGDSSEADLAGYRFQRNLCDAVTIKAFLERYESRSTGEPNTHYASRQQGLDSGNCSWSLKEKSSTTTDYTSVFVNGTAQWHEESDPTGEFAAQYKGYEDRSDDSYSYRTKPVDGIGDEAYLVTEKRGISGPKQLSSMTLGVRDGWFTFELRWSWYGGTTSSAAKPPTEQEAQDMLTSDTRDALAELKKS